jgi:hypothetical protein
MCGDSRDAAAALANATASAAAALAAMLAAAALAHYFRQDVFAAGEVCERQHDHDAPAPIHLEALELSVAVGPVACELPRVGAHVAARASRLPW